MVSSNPSQFKKFPVRNSQFEIPNSKNLQPEKSHCEKPQTWKNIPVIPPRTWNFSNWEFRIGNFWNWEFRIGNFSNLEFTGFKVKLFGCKNWHLFENLSFFDINKYQLINESKIICAICKKVNKAITYNNSFFIYTTCKQNICPLCNSSHDKDHNIIGYKQKNFICNLHNESYAFYCNDCNKNICILCEIEHNNHNKTSLVLKGYQIKII